MKEVLTKEGLVHYTALLKHLIDEAEPNSIEEAAIEEMFGGTEVEIPTSGFEHITINITKRIFENGRTGATITVRTIFSDGEELSEEVSVYDGEAGADGKSIFCTDMYMDNDTNSLVIYGYDIKHGDSEIAVGDLIISRSGWIGRVNSIETYGENAETNEYEIVRFTNLKGKDGADGLTPYIGSNGNWWTGEYDTGVNAGGSGGTGEVTEEQIAAAVEAYLAKHPLPVATAVRIAEVELLAANWVGDASPYSQVVTIPGITNYSQVDLTPSVEQLAIFHDKDLTFVAENEDSVVTVYAIGDKPLNDYTMQATIKEVSV